jgi:hypothetical protein
MKEQTCSKMQLNYVRTGGWKLSVRTWGKGWNGRCHLCDESGLMPIGWYVLIHNLALYQQSW